MPSRIVRLAYLGFLTVSLGSGLGYAISQDGGMVTWGWNICLLVVGLVGAAHWLTTPAKEFAPALHPRLGLALLFLPAYVALQLVPLPLFLVRILSPARAQLADALGAVMPRPTFVPLSVAPSITSSYLLRAVGYTIVFLLLREITWRVRQEWRQQSIQHQL